MSNSRRKMSLLTPFRVFVMMVIIVTIMAIAGVCYIWRSEIMPVSDLAHEQYPVVGVDLSAHNGRVDFESLYADSVSFIYLKATEGASFHDMAFERNYKAARSAGRFAIGAYHFFRFDVNGALQAKNFLEVIAGKSLELPPAIDIEEHGNPDTPTEVVVQRIQDMIQQLELHSIHPVIYTNMDGYRRFYSHYLVDYPLWVSRFVQPPDDVDWVIWQYSHWGDVEGVEGDVDLNVFNGSRSDFNDWISPE